MNNILKTNGFDTPNSNGFDTPNISLTVYIINNILSEFMRPVLVLRLS